jgi:carbon starvation protein
MVETQGRQGWQLSVDDKAFAQLEGDMGEPLRPGEDESGLRGRTGGAVTLAVGMAKVFADLPGMKTLASYWYHFVIMFEALFILTLLETGTRVARFVFQEAVAVVVPRAAPGGKPKWSANVLMSMIVCLAWGGLLYIGNLDTLWRMLGIANQLLASIALAVGTTYILRNSPKRIYALCTGVPLVFVLATVMTAGIQSAQAWWATAFKPETPASDVFLLKLATVLAWIMLGLTAVITIDAVRRWWVTLRAPAAIEPTVD